MRKLLTALAFAGALSMPTLAHASNHDKIDDGFFARIQHQVADATGIAWLHPAPPVPSHSQHVAWHALTPDVIAAAQPYATQPEVAALLKQVSALQQQVAQGGLPVYTDITLPQHPQVHRLHEAVAQLLQRIGYLGNGEGRTHALIETANATLELYADNIFCGNERQPGEGHTAERPPVPRFAKLVAAIPALFLLGFLGFVHLRRRRQLA